LFMPVFLWASWSEPEQTMKLAQIVIGLPLLMATVSGGILGNINGLETKRPQGPFLFTRPLSSAALVRDKLWMGLLSTAATWAVMLPLAVLFLFRPSCLQSLSQWVTSVPPWKAFVLPPVVAALVFALSWKQLVENYWIALTGREWLIGVFTGGFVFLVFFAMGVGLWLAFHPEQVALFSAAAKWLMAIVVGIKGLVAALVVRELDRARLLSRKFMLWMGGLWAAVVAGALSLAIYYVPRGEVSLVQVALGIILVIPFSRLMGSPLAVEWNRHR